MLQYNGLVPLGFELVLLFFEFAFFSLEIAEFCLICLKVGIVLFYTQSMSFAVRFFGAKL